MTATKISPLASAETPTNLVKLRALPWSIASEASNAVYSQLTFWGSPFVLFFSELNLSNGEIGFIFSLLPFFGLSALLIAPAIARNGYKRTYISFYIARKLITLQLLFVPWIDRRYDGQYTLPFITLVFILFALVRAVANTAYFPWRQEYIPNSVRGKYAATLNIVVQLTSVATVAFAGYVVGHSADINRFLYLIVIAVVFGLIAMSLATRIPGGAPAQLPPTQRGGLRATLDTLRDSNFRLYLMGLGVVTFAVTPEATFVPLFMQREAGLTQSQVVLLQTGTLVGGLLSTFFWGWASDRFGSKPIILSSLYLQIFLIIGWLILPRNTPYTLVIAFVLAGLQGIIAIAWVIAAGRLLYVRIVPTEQKSAYMAVYYAVLGLFGGISQLLSGQLIDLTANWSGQFVGITITPFTPLFAMSLLLTLVGIVYFYRVSADNTYSFGEFASMFMRGNPVNALSSMVRYYHAPDERGSINATAQLGLSNSRIAVDELVDALHDPRFNVRFEAIIAMARMRPDARIVQALHEVVQGTELSLTGPAIWALGRLASPASKAILQATLNAEYASIRASGARALGAYGDVESEAELLARLLVETNAGLKMAYASALGNLGSWTAIPELVRLLDSAENPGARLELTLSLARIVGNEKRFVALLRQARGDLGTTIAQTLIPLRKLHLARSKGDGSQEQIQLLNATIESFAAGTFDQATELFGRLIEQLAEPLQETALAPILTHCTTNFRKTTVRHDELIVLAAHLLRERQL
jgi:MFS family permease